jgi:hypothetical protein
MKNPAVDVVVAVLAGQTVRLDTRSGEMNVLPRDGRSNLAEAVSAGLRAQPLKRGSRVLVLASDFFTQAVRLPALQTNGLSKEDLQSALVFEVEPFSNISRDQGGAAFVASDESAGIVTWQVLQIANGDIAALVAAVRAAGGRAVGFAPAGEALASATEERFPELLKAAAADAVSSSPAFPVVVPSAAGLAANRLAAVAGVLLAGAALACLVHFSSANARLSSLKTQVSALERLEADNAQVAAAVKSLEAKIGAIEKARHDRGAGEKELLRYRAAWGTLIRSLPEACGERVVIRQIESRAAFDAEFEGSSVTEKGPGDCMARLAQSVGEAGWRVEPERMQGVTATGGNGPVRFRFRVSLENGTGVAETPSGGRAAAPPAVDVNSADAWRYDF